LIFSVEKRAEEILRSALRLHATDIHISPRSRHAAVYFRVLHRLLPRYTLSHEETERLITYWKFKASMDIGEKRRPQNGSFTAEIDGRKIGLRISTLPLLFSESLVIRLLPQDEFRPVRQLTLFPKSADILLRLLKRPHGLILLAGPTGSGKTTTLYSLLYHSAVELKRNVITLEDPVEKYNENFLQMQVNEKAGITYAAGLKAILRHDPDVILIGEIRDAETAKIAVRAALTGHLVLSSLHAKNSLGALYRLLEFGAAWGDLRQTLLCVCAQRLVERSCPLCPDGRCSPYCHHMANKRAAVFEFLFGNPLQEAIDGVREGKGEVRFPTLGAAINKGIALGFIRKEEYERWVESFAEEMEG